MSRVAVTFLRKMSASIEKRQRGVEFASDLIKVTLGRAIGKAYC
jgi:hypothetical protein